MGGWSNYAQLLLRGIGSGEVLSDHSDDFGFSEFV